MKVCVVCEVTKENCRFRRGGRTCIKCANARRKHDEITRTRGLMVRADDDAYYDEVMALHGAAARLGLSFKAAAGAAFREWRGAHDAEFARGDRGHCAQAGGIETYPP